LEYSSPDGTLYGEGQGVIRAKDSSNEMTVSAKVGEYGVGKYSSTQVDNNIIINKQFGEVQHSTNLLLPMVNSLSLTI
jgi:hypothetical protein